MRLGFVEMKSSIAPRIGLLLSLSLFAALPAVAGNWKRVADDENTRIEIDVASLARNGNIVKAWERETHRKPEQAKPGDFFYSSAKTLAQHHCTERTTTYLFRGYFAADGSEIKTLAAGTDLGKVDFLVPDSPEERKLIFACTYGVKKPDKPSTPPAPTDKAAEPPATPTKQAPAKTAEKDTKKGAPPAKTAEKGGKAPVERKPEKAAETKSAATKPPSSAAPGKTPAVK